MTLISTWCYFFVQLDSFYTGPGQPQVELQLRPYRSSLKWNLEVYLFMQTWLAKLHINLWLGRNAEYWGININYCIALTILWVFNPRYILAMFYLDGRMHNTLNIMCKKICLLSNQCFRYTLCIVICLNKTHIYYIKA